LYSSLGITAREIFFIDPNAENPQSTLKKIHTFVPESTFADDKEVGDYGRGVVATAIVEDPRKPDQFYTLASQHGKPRVGQSSGLIWPHSIEIAQ
jgi:hypothetical protein